MHRSGITDGRAAATVPTPLRRERRRAAPSVVVVSTGCRRDAPDRRRGLPRLPSRCDSQDSTVGFPRCASIPIPTVKMRLDSANGETASDAAAQRTIDAATTGSASTLNTPTASRSTNSWPPADSPMCTMAGHGWLARERTSARLSERDVGRQAPRTGLDVEQPMRLRRPMPDGRCRGGSRHRQRPRSPTTRAC